MVWRPVMTGKATLSEIEKHYSITDLAKLNDLMDLQDEQERRHAKQVQS